MSPALEAFVGAWLVVLAVMVLVIRRRSDVASDNRTRRWLGVRQKQRSFALTRVDLILKVVVVAGVGLVLLVQGILRL